MERRSEFELKKGFEKGIKADRYCSFYNYNVSVLYNESAYPIGSP